MKFKIIRVKICYKQVLGSGNFIRKHKKGAIEGHSEILTNYLHSHTHTYMYEICYIAWKSDKNP